MTFDATVNPVVYEGGVPIFIDTEYGTWNMDCLLYTSSDKEQKVLVLYYDYGYRLKDIAIILKESDSLSLIHIRCV